MAGGRRLGRQGHCRRAVVTPSNLYKIVIIILFSIFFHNCKRLGNKKRVLIQPAWAAEEVSWTRTGRRNYYGRCDTPARISTWLSERNDL